MNSETNTRLHEIAFSLDQAACEGRSIPQFSLEEGFDLEEAYRIQKLSLDQRIGRGEKARGVKLGFTSKAKMRQMGVDSVIWGQLTDQMEIGNGGQLELSSFVHPRVEPEIAFRLKKNVNTVLDMTQAKEVIDGIAIALEVIDSRYENFRFSLEDVVADNCSSSAFVLGEWKDPGTTILDIDLELFIDGELEAKGPSTAILGNPFESLVEAIRISIERGYELKEGQVILAGAATAAVFLKAGQAVKARAQRLGEVSLTVVP